MINKGTILKPRFGGGNRLEVLSIDEDQVVSVEVLRAMFCPNETILVNLDELLASYEIDSTPSGRRS